ncbi:MAG: OsmC family peroxiredoxin [Galactobacter sp.]
MPVTSKATTTWTGDLTDGSGAVEFVSSRIGTYPINWKARSKGADATTTPEELIAAAHASCFSMALSNALAQNGTPAGTLTTTAAVAFVPGEGIKSSELNLKAEVEGLDAETFADIAEDAKKNCPVSQALAGIEITLNAQLV